MSTWIQTYTGRRVEPLALTPEMVCLEDIAHALALQTRYTGHCREFYSIAQHAVLVSHLVEALGGDLASQWWGLHHDDAEAYLGDWPRPVKGSIGIAVRTFLAGVIKIYRPFADVEHDALVTIANALECPMGHARDLVKHCDNLALALEAPALITGSLEGWDLPLIDPEIVGSGLAIPMVVQPILNCMGPGGAEAAYLYHHQKITAALAAARSAA